MAGALALGGCAGVHLNGATAAGLRTGPVIQKLVTRPWVLGRPELVSCQASGPRVWRCQIGFRGGRTSRCVVREPGRRGAFVYVCDAVGEVRR